MVDFARARDIVLRHGWNTTCYQILNPGMSHWFSEEYDAVVGYVECAGHRLVAGAPVCPVEDLTAVMREWQATCDQTCYVGAESRLSEIARSQGHGVTAIGSQPLWTPSEFLMAFDHHRSLKEQRRRARAKGVIIREWNLAVNDSNGSVMQCLRAWLASKPIPNMRFLVEPDVFSFWGDRRLFVAEANKEVCGFVVLCPIPSRNGWLTEDFVRHPDAPNGTVELALYEAVRAVGSDALLTMGMCPLSTRASLAADNPWWLSTVAKLGWRVGRVFYNFQGLEGFKSKFQPSEWEAVTIVSAQGKLKPGDLMAIVEGFTGYHPALIPWHYAKRRMRPIRHRSPD